jgi:putative membrane protein
MRKTSLGLFWFIACLLLAGAGTAGAHGMAAAAESARWTLDPWVVTPLAAGGLLYASGVARLHERARNWPGSRTWQACSYAAAWLMLGGALVSPLHWLGEHLFTFHMIEHELVMVVAAPLFVLARPAGPMLWALPAPLRRATARAAVQPVLRSAWLWLTRPRHATLLHGLAIWIWHLPLLFDAAVVNLTLHRLQHLSFLVTALFFWWAMLRRSAPGGAVWHLFITMVHTSVLGALMALAPRVLYHVQTAAAPAFGLTPLEDQQLAGIIMWVPAETVYAGAALALAALWIRRSADPVSASVHARAMATSV